MTKAVGHAHWWISHKALLMIHPRDIFAGQVMPAKREPLVAFEPINKEFFE